MKRGGFSNKGKQPSLFGQIGTYHWNEFVNVCKSISKNKILI